MRRTFLLGVIGNEIITGEMEVTSRNGYREFTASFNQGTAFDINEIEDDEYKERYFNELWECYDDSQKIEALRDGEITKSEAFEEWDDERYYNDYHDLIDCSCTDYELTLEDGTDINFETTACGQHDCREEEDFSEMIFTNKEAFNDLMELWDNYHLKNIEDVQNFDKKINSIIEKLKNFEEYENGFDEFIINNIEL